tara:strand:+ start:4521 stop:5363 length:843 start_codon:yes stop_codon:yes gene_type:complete
MKIIKSISEFFDWRSKINSSIGFTPTMGALHDGHLSLIKKSKLNCEVSIASIFVNPTQFAKNEDFGSYPKTLDNDIRLLNTLGVDVLFLPNEEEMYTKLEDVNVPSSELFKKLEGKSRPHFFYGVTKIVSKLFNVVAPTHAFFGEKDAQQLIIINEMISNMNYPIKLVSCPTVRDTNGLALSSRNQYLSKKEQIEASFFSQSLFDVERLIKGGELNSSILKNHFKKCLSQSKKIKVDYISIANKKTLNEVNAIKGNVLISAAVFFNDVRLIDNFTHQSST